MSARSKLKKLAWSFLGMSGLSAAGLMFAMDCDRQYNSPLPNTNTQYAPQQSLKNQSYISPLSTAEFYADYFDGHETSIKTHYTDGTSHDFQLARRIDNASSSFSGALFINPTDGHAVLFFKGMDLPGRDEGAGSLGFLTDLRTIFQNRCGCISQQMLDAEKMYLDALNDTRIKSLEIVGYSIGSSFLNYISAKHGAVGTTIADMGLHQNIFEQANSETTSQITQRVTSLHLSMDKLPQWFSASAAHGTIINLDEDKISDWAAIAHIPQIYASKSAHSNELK